MSLFAITFRTCPQCQTTFRLDIPPHARVFKPCPFCKHVTMPEDGIESSTPLTVSSSAK